MPSKLELMNPDLVDRILAEAFQLLMNPGVKVLSQEAQELLPQYQRPEIEPQKEDKRKASINKLPDLDF